MTCESNGTTALPSRMRYTRRIFANGTVHYCIQNTLTGDLVKHPRHNMRPFIRHDEIPLGVAIHEWMEAAQ